MYLFLLSWLFGCTQADSSCATTPPALTVGTGDTAFVPLADGDTVPLVHGPQGGWHILVSLRVEGTEPAVHIGLQLADEQTGALVADTAYDMLLEQDDACTATVLGLFDYVDTTALDATLTPPEVLPGRPLQLGVSLRDAAWSELHERLAIRVE